MNRRFFDASELQTEASFLPLTRLVGAPGYGRLHWMTGYLMERLFRPTAHVDAVLRPYAELIGDRRLVAVQVP